MIRACLSLLGTASCILLSAVLVCFFIDGPPCDNGRWSLTALLWVASPWLAIGLIGLAAECAIAFDGRDES